jgi:hypothetical protein
MSAHFSFATDRRLGLVRIVLTGLFEPADVARFLEARAAAHAELGWAPNRHLTLNDVRALKIQPQQTVAAFHQLLADPAYRSRRLAFVVGPTLVRSQLMRALASRDSRCFADVAAAEAWLLAEEGADAAAMGTVTNNRPR